MHTPADAVDSKRLPGSAWGGPCRKRSGSVPGRPVAILHADRRAADVAPPSCMQCPYRVVCRCRSLFETHVAFDCSGSTSAIERRLFRIDEPWRRTPFSNGWKRVEMRTRRCVRSGVGRGRVPSLRSGALLPSSHFTAAFTAGPLRTIPSAEGRRLGLATRGRASGLVTAGGRGAGHDTTCRPSAPRSTGGACGGARRGEGPLHDHRWDRGDRSGSAAADRGYSCDGMGT